MSLTIGAPAAGLCLYFHHANRWKIVLGSYAGSWLLAFLNTKLPWPRHDMRKYLWLSLFIWFPFVFTGLVLSYDVAHFLYGSLPIEVPR